MSANSKFIWGLILLFFATVLASPAQNNVPILEKKISIQLKSESVENILQAIEREAGFTFSYTPQVITIKEPVSIEVTQKSVREILNKVFQGQVSYKEKGNHVILKRVKIHEEEEEKNWFVISGYVTNENGLEISNVSIYDKKSRESAISNKYGFFSITIENRNKEKSKELILSVNKNEYKDTVVYVRQNGNSIVNITLFPEEDLTIPIDSLVYRDSILQADQMAFINFLLSQEVKINTRNITDTIHQKYQVSLIPYFGTNLKLSGNTINDYSFNILGGYSMGTRKVELAGLFNIDRDSVKYLQIAGLSNFNGGPISGLQMAGLSNVNLRPSSSTALSGLVNLSLDSAKGLHAAGLLNVNLKYYSGLQMAGLLNTNVTKEASGVQAAGLLNVSTGNVQGLQIAGLMNVCVKKIEGVQASSLLNYARSVEGAQIGFLNISDSCTGVPIGFLSYVRRGYHQVEISVDEFYPINISARSGVQSFYNILSTGMKLDSLEEIQWYFGYGLGSALNLGKKWNLNFDLTMNQSMHGNTINSFSPLSKLSITIEKRFSKYFSIATGPSLNYLVYDATDSYFQSLASDLPATVFKSSKFSGDYFSKLWIGGKIALRFF